MSPANILPCAPAAVDEFLSEPTPNALGAVTSLPFGRPETSVEQMIQWIAAWLAEGGATWGKPTAFESRDGQF